MNEETLQLTKYLQFSDDQLGVYSMHIADLIMRVAVEIEALSKELYKDNHGPDMFDENGKKRNFFLIQTASNTLMISGEYVIVKLWYLVLIFILLKMKIGSLNL